MSPVQPSAWSACEADRFEGDGGNNSADSVSALAGHVHGVTLWPFDVDYYQIDLQAGEALEFVTFNHQLGDIDYGC